MSGYNSTYSRTRHLRSSSKPRDLETYQPKCKRNCEGFPDKRCKATGCLGYRRSLGETGDAARDLASGKSFSCATQIEFINRELDKLVNDSRVSSSCQTLLTKPRTTDCYDDVIFGVVDRVVLWQVTPTRTVLESKYAGKGICRNTRVDFEPITNTCVDYLVSTVTGPNNFLKNSTRSDYNVSPATKTIFGNANAQSAGVVFSNVGTYTLKSVPDGFQNKALNLNFEVVTGSVEAVRLWDTTTNTIINPNFTGGNLCRSKPFNLEFVVGSCATSISATIKGPGLTKSDFDTSRPFSMFGDGGGRFTGGTLPSLGTYNLTLFPDQIQSAQAKSIVFNMVNC